MSMAIYHRMQNYYLYYPEGFYILGYVFLPLSVDKNRVEELERSIHSLGKKYANEWFYFKNKDELAKLLINGNKKFPEAKIHTDMSIPLSLPDSYRPMKLKDKNAINKVVNEYEAEVQAKIKELDAIKNAQNETNNLGTAFNTIFHSIKRK